MPYFLCLAFCLLLGACQNTPSSNSTTTTTILTAQALDVSLNMTQPRFQLGLPVTLRFVLHNNQADSIRFCYLNSPAHEMVWSDFFVVTNANGQAMPYIGQRPLYQGPASAEHSMTLAPNEMKIYTLDLLPLYQMNEKGQYSVHFVGDSINLLPNSTPARFVLE